jgi:DNA-binding FadR family transcriptional regulator
MVIATDPLRRIVAGLKGPAHDTLAEIAEVRRILEKPAFLLAGQRASDEEIDALAEVVEALADLLDQPEQFTTTDFEFHVRVVGLSKNILLFEHYEALLRRVRQVRSEFPMAHMVPLPRALQNQRDVYEALRRRDATEIATAVDRHFADFEDIILGEPLALPF